MTLTIDEEFKNLIPPLSDEEFTQLEENILRDGIQDPLKVWRGTLIDGHNRYNIAQKHNLDFKVTEMDFPDKDAVKEWIIFNQFGRRNISVYGRICLALKLKPIFSVESKQRMEKGISDPKQIFAQGTTNEKIAKLAGVSKETVRKVEKIQEIAKSVEMSDIISGLKKGDISISLAYETAIYRNQKLESESESVEKIKYHLKQAKENFGALKSSLAKIQSQIPPNEFENYLKKELNTDRNSLEKTLNDWEQILN